MRTSPRNEYTCPMLLSYPRQPLICIRALLQHNCCECSRRALAHCINDEGNLEEPPPCISTTGFMHESLILRWLQASDDANPILNGGS